MGFLITFEGVEGCGKSTQVQLLKDTLEKKGKSVLLTREPGGTKFGDSIRKLLLDSAHKEMARRCELFLYCASRAQHVAEVLKPALAKGSIVLCDRYIDATTAYQGYARGFPLDFIATLNKESSEGLVPNLTFLLDLDPALGLQRTQSRLQGQQSKALPNENRFEEEPLAFHQRVQKGYLTVAAAEPKRFCVLDARLPIDKIQTQIIQKVEQALS